MKFKCPFCGREFNTRQQLFAHMQTLENHNYTEQFLLNFIISLLVKDEDDRS